MRCMLAAAGTELLQLDTVRSRLPVLRARIVAFLAVTALHGNDLSGHCSLQTSSYD